MEEILRFLNDHPPPRRCSDPSREAGEGKVEGEVERTEEEMLTGALALSMSMEDEQKAV